MRIAVISITKEGGRLSERLERGLCGRHVVERYCFHRHPVRGAMPFVSAGELAAELFHERDALIFICALGIAVRSIAPLVSSKLSDPAVVVLDDSRRWAIPLLSGHIGGANSLAKEAAGIVGAEAVITTATDVRGRFSPDCFAMDNNLVIQDMAAAKRAAAASANGEPLYFFSEYETEKVPEGLICLDDRDGLKDPGLKDAAVIYVGASPVRDCPGQVCAMVPRNIVLGIGCKRNTGAGKIGQAAAKALALGGIPPERVVSVGTIDIKKNEPGLIEFCGERGVRLITFSAEELNRTDEMYGTGKHFHGSDFVKDVTGTDNVCERSAVLLSGGGRLVVPKTKGEGVTVAVAEKEVYIRFGAGNG